MVFNWYIHIIMKEAMKVAGITKKACVHTLRHSYATHQLEAGQSIYGVKHLLGHAEIATVIQNFLSELHHYSSSSDIVYIAAMPNRGNGR